MNRYLLLAGTLVVFSAMGSVPGAAASGSPGEFRFAPYIHFWPMYNGCGGEPHCDVAYGFDGVWVGDMTGDGLDDVVTAPHENEIWIIPQQPDRTLQLDAPRKFIYGDNVYTHSKHFVLGDFNEDGAQDLVGNFSGYGLGMNVLLSDGAGDHVLHEMHDLPSPYGFHTDWRHPAAEDVDGDGNLDVLLFLGHWDINAPQPPAGVAFVAIRYGDGEGNFPRMALVQLADHQAMRAELADFDGDGHRDIALQVVVGFPGESLLAVSYHDGRTGFLPAVVTDIPFQNGATFADFDGDRRAEMTLDMNWGVHAVPVSDPASSFTIGPAQHVHPSVALAADLDRDGRQDLFTTQFTCPYFCSWTYLAPYLNLATGWLPIHTPPGSDPHIPQNVAQHPRSFASGDVNSDGCTDVVTAHAQDGLAILHGTGCVAPQALRSDFDGAGRSDVLWRNPATGRNALWLGGDYADQRNVRMVDAPGWIIGGTADFDGDGVNDVLWRNTRSGANVAWRGAEYGSGMEITDVTGLAWFVAATGDFDGDGRADVLWRHPGTGKNVVWRSADYATQVVLQAVSAGWHVAGTGDFDGDRRADILWHSPSTRRSVIWRHGDYGDQQPVPVASPGWAIAGIGDFDGDDIADILWRNATTGANVAWRRGDAGDVLQVTDVTSQDWSVAAVGDYDGDGRDDLFWRNARTGANVIWRNADYHAQTGVTRVSNLDWHVVP